MDNERKTPRFGEIWRNKDNGWLQLVFCSNGGHVVCLTLMLRPHYGDTTIPFMFNDKQYYLVADMPYTMLPRQYGECVGYVSDEDMASICKTIAQCLGLAGIR